MNTTISKIFKFFLWMMLKLGEIEVILLGKRKHVKECHFCNISFQLPLASPYILVSLKQSIALWSLGFLATSVQFQASTANFLSLFLDTQDTAWKCTVFLILLTRSLCFLQSASLSHNNTLICDLQAWFTVSLCT